MRFHLPLFKFVALATALLFYNNSQAQTVDADFVDGRLYVKIMDVSSMDLSNYNQADPVLNQIIADYGITSMEHAFKTPGVKMERVYRITFTAISQSDNLIDDLAALPFIEYAEKAPIFHLTYIPNDYAQSEQYALNIINATQAWDINKGSNSVVVAIVDNAVNFNHEDVLPNRWVNSGETPGNGLDDDLNGFTDDVYGYDVADGDADPTPPSTGGPSFVHGTHCAGITSARTDNGVGIASLGYKVSIMSVKCTPNSGQGNTLPNAYEGVDYAIRAGADIVSMSFGSSSGFLTWEVLINQAQTMGVMLIAAAGNEDTDAVSYPAGYPYVFSVGATDNTDKRASFSNYGSTLDVMAPGVSIKSTFWPGNGAYGNLSGTSMACPLVAGLAGLLKSYDSSLTVADLKAFIKDGCKNIDAQNPSYIGKMGSGRINAFKSMQLASGLTIGEINNDTFTFDLFPNPNAGTFFLVPHQSLPERSLVTLVDLSGKKVYEKEFGIQFEDNPMTVETKNLQQGMYLMKFNIGDFQEVRRIIIR